jgi:hypothetical protein
MSNDNLDLGLFKTVIDAVKSGLHVSGLHIDGIEVTQAIQYRSADQHLTDPADRGPDNSVRLVADKSARVRVYVRNLPEPVEGVTGAITVQRQQLGVWYDIETLAKLGSSSVTAEPSPNYAAERGNMSSSLNFMLPAAILRGYLRLKVEVSSRGGNQTDRQFIDIDASLLQKLKIRGIPIRYVGEDAAAKQIDLPAPTLANFQTTAATSLRMFPVSQTPDISLAGTFTWDTPLLGDIVNGACPQSWNNLLFWLSFARIVDGNRGDSLYYGLFPMGLPTGGASGCGGSANVGSGAVGDGMTMAHELGHVLGLVHGPCGLGAGDVGDPNYPAYEPYDTVANRTASLGEYGCDVTDGTVYPPQNVRDFMSYCGPQWISLYHMQRLLYHQMFNPQIVAGPRQGLPAYVDQRHHFPPPVLKRPTPEPQWKTRQIRLLREADPVRLIVVTGILHADHIEIRSVIRLITGPAANGERIEGTSVELLNANSEVVHRTSLRRMATQASCGCGGSGGNRDEPPTGLVQALLPDTEVGSTLRVMVSDKVFWTRDAPSAPPVISSLSARVDNDRLYVSWQTTASSTYPIERAVRWSSDNGKQWQALAVKLEDDAAVVPTCHLTPGPILVHVIVSDGFHSTTSEGVPVDIPRCPPTVAILWPAEGATVRMDELVRLWGVATASDGSILPAEAMQWTVDGEYAGTGPEVWASPGNFDGEHTATLQAKDADHSASATVSFLTSCSGRNPYRRDQS